RDAKAGILSRRNQARGRDRQHLSGNRVRHRKALLRRRSVQLVTQPAYLIDGIRTPVGNLGGALSDVRPDDLGALVIAEVMPRNPSLDPSRVSDVVLGCANQAGEDNRNVARMALLLAGLPTSVPGETINRLCASGMSAVVNAARAVQVGDGDFYIAGGA